MHSNSNWFHPKRSVVGDPARIGGGHKTKRWKKMMSLARPRDQAKAKRWACLSRRERWLAWWSPIGWKASHWSAELQLNGRQRKRVWFRACFNSKVSQWEVRGFPLFFLMFREGAQPANGQKKFLGEKWRFSCRIISSNYVVLFPTQLYGIKR